MPYVPITKPESEGTEIALHWNGGHEGGNFQLAVGIPVEVLREQLRLYDDPDTPYAVSITDKMFFYSEQITREQANNLIRSTRRARNAVHGADE